MKDADFILDWTEDLKARATCLPFPEDDIRVDFHRLIYDSSYNYYRGIVMGHIAYNIASQNISMKGNLLRFKEHINRMVEIVVEPTLSDSLRNSLNRALLIDSWSIFELSVTTLVSSVATEIEISRLKSFRYRHIMKYLKHSEIDENDRKSLLSNLSEEDLSHVPIVRKTDLLFKKCTGYSRDLPEDKEFLRFYGKLRNSYHSNFIYHGKDYEYSFGHAHFKFKKNQTVVWRDPFSPSPKLQFYLLGNLVKIWEEIAKSINVNHVKSNL